MACTTMGEIFHHHVPVLLNESVQGIVTAPDGIYVDATFGRGSHSQAILNRLNQHGRLIAFDKDPEAVAFAKVHFANEPRFNIFHNSFAMLKTVLSQLQAFGQLNGILFDLGVSSPQLDNPARGFSFSKPGKLDMRMDNTRGVDAMTWIKTVDEKTLADVLYQYGEEKFSRRIAKAIVAARKEATIATTNALADIISRAIPRRKQPGEKHPATRSFQAIRIAVNEELHELEVALQQALEALKIGGRLGIISFHSLEDRMVKQFIKHHEKGEALPHGLPVKGDRFSARLKTLGKAIKASQQEIEENPRARSAILRIAEKIS